LESIWNLRCDIEIIVIDGLSTDGCIEYLESVKIRIDILVCEPDHGIYDAMNKGILRAHGNWVIFMNSGDWFVDHFNLAALMEALAHEPAQMILGNAIVHYPGGKTRSWLAENPDKFWKGMVAAHQAVIYRREIIVSFLFSTRFKIAGDFEQLYRIYKAGIPFKILDVFIANIGPGGISDSQRVQTMKELFSIVKNDLRQSQKIFLHLNIIYQYIIVFVKRTFSLVGINLNRGKNSFQPFSNPPTPAS